MTQTIERFENIVQLDSGLIVPASAATGKVLMSDTEGNATWQPEGIGIISTFAGASNVPTNYHICNGEELSRTTYPALFSALTYGMVKYSLTSGSKILTLPAGSVNEGLGIGWYLEGTGFAEGAKILKLVGEKEVEMSIAATATVKTTENKTVTFFPWGNGNKTTTFNIPKITAGTSMVQSTGTNAYPVGISGGEKEVTLTELQMPKHTHAPPGGSEGTAFLTGGATNSNIGTGSSFATASHTGSAGGGTAHNNMPPYVGVQYIIKVQ